METEYRTVNTRRVSALRRDIEKVNVAIDTVNHKLEFLKLKLDQTPDVGHKIEDIIMDARTQRMLELEERHKLHSAQLKLLQKEVDHVQTENEYLMSYVHEHESPRGNRADHGLATDSRLGYDGQGRKDDGYRDTVPKSPDRSRHVTPQPRTNADNGGYMSPRKNGNDRPDLRNTAGDLDPKWRHVEGKTNAGAAFDLDELEKKRRAQIYGFHDSTAINPHLWEDKPKHRKYPWFDHETHPYPGGFLIMRFDDAGYEVCTLALKSQQSICRHAGGYLLGMSRKDRIFVYESAPSKQKNWSISRQQRYKDVMTTEDALAVFWFTRKDAASAFFDNCHRNKFRDPCFPTPNGYEAVYVPLLAPPTKPLNTFLAIELLDAKKYSQEDMTQFEGEVRNDMLRVYPNCLPMVVSSLTGREMFKPGMLISHYSKFYMSRFDSQREVDQIWNLGMIQALRQKWRLTGPINVFSFTIDIAG